MPTISVIVPVYNTEKYLHRCIDSVLAQTLTDFELLLINDGSTDASGAICDEYAAKDDRVRVFHKKNGGVSSARNLGLDNAKSGWIVFVDSDDWVENHYLEVLFQGGKYDFVTSYWRLINDEIFTSLVPEEYEYRGVSGIRTFLDINIGKISYPVCRLYRKSILSEHGLYFNDKIHCSEDALFNISYLQYINSIKQIGETVYNYEKHVDSLSRVNIPWEEMNYTITMLGRQINKLEIILSWNGERLFQYHIWSGLLRKYLTYLQFDVSLGKCMNKLSEICKNEYVQKIFYSSSHSKSVSRKIFDFFMRKNRFLFAALLLKIEYCLLKYGVVIRK